MTQQKNLRLQVKRVVGDDPFAAVADVAQKNIARWKALQEEVLRRFVGATRADDHRVELLPQDRNKA